MSLKVLVLWGGGRNIFLFVNFSPRFEGSCCLHFKVTVLFPYLTDKRWPDSLVIFLFDFLLSVITVIVCVVVVIDC